MINLSQAWLSVKLSQLIRLFLRNWCHFLILHRIDFYQENQLEVRNQSAEFSHFFNDIDPTVKFPHKSINYRKLHLWYPWWPSRIRWDQPRVHTTNQKSNICQRWSIKVKLLWLFNTFHRKKITLIFVVRLISCVKCRKSDTSLWKSFRLVT